MKHSITRNVRNKSFALLALLIVVYPTGAVGQSEDRVLATVADRVIREREVDEVVAAQLLPLQQQIYAIRKTALDNMITRAILEGEARKLEVSVEELRRRLATKDSEVNSAEIEKAYAENAEFFAGMSPDEARERLRLDLENQKRMRQYKLALSKLRDSVKVELRLEEPRLRWLLGIDSAFAKGSEGSEITIVEFADFQCPYCRSVQSAINRVMDVYGDRVHLVFRQLPLDIHEQAFVAARAAVCAGQQRMFWHYHDALFATTDLSLASLNEIAARKGLDSKAFKECTQSEASRSAVLKDVAEAKRLGIKVTPSFVVNGKLITGAISFDEFEKVLQAELESQSARQKASGIEMR